MSKIANFRNEYTEVYPTDVFKVSKDDGLSDKKIAFSDMGKQQAKIIYSNRIVDSYLVNDDGDIELTLANPNYEVKLKDGITFRFTLRNIEYDWQWKVNPTIVFNGSTPKPLYNGRWRIDGGYLSLDRNTLGNGVHEIVYNIDDDAWLLYKIGTESGQFEEDTEDGDKAGSLMFDETIDEFLTANKDDFPITINKFGTPIGLFETVIAGCNGTSTLNKRVNGVIGDIVVNNSIGSFTAYNTTQYSNSKYDTVVNSLSTVVSNYNLLGYIGYANHDQKYVELFTDKSKSIKYVDLPSGVHTNTTRTELFTRRLRVYYRYIL